LSRSVPDANRSVITNSGQAAPLQEQDIAFKLENSKLSPAQERRYKKFRTEIIAEVKSLRLHHARINSLVQQLYDINKRLLGYEGRLMRLAESHGVALPRPPYFRDQRRARRRILAWVSSVRRWR
jgi:Sigma-70, non-essential region